MSIQADIQTDSDLKPGFCVSQETSRRKRKHENETSDLHHWQPAWRNSAHTLVLVLFSSQRVLASLKNQALAPQALPVIDDFEAGVPATWFTYGDWGNGAVYDFSAVLTNSLTTPAVVSDTVLRVDYVYGGWGVGGGKDLAPDDWSAYDGLSLWFYGSNWHHLPHYSIRQQIWVRGHIRAIRDHLRG